MYLPNLCIIYEYQHKFALYIQGYLIAQHYLTRGLLTLPKTYQNTQSRNQLKREISTPRTVQKIK